MILNSRVDTTKRESTRTVEKYMGNLMLGLQQMSNLLLKMHTLQIDSLTRDSEVTTKKKFRKSNRECLEDRKEIDKVLKIIREDT